MKKGFSTYIAAPEMKEVVVLYDDVFLASAYNEISPDDGEAMKNYIERACIIQMPERAMKLLSLKEGDHVMVKTERGIIVVKAMGIEDESFLIPKSPIVLSLCEPGEYRQIMAVLTKTDKEVSELLIAPNTPAH